jgi:hypothetical protein
MPVAPVAELVAAMELVPVALVAPAGAAGVPRLARACMPMMPRTRAATRAASAVRALTCAAAGTRSGLRVLTAFLGTGLIGFDATGRAFSRAAGCAAAGVDDHADRDHGREQPPERGEKNARGDRDARGVVPKREDQGQAHIGGRERGGVVDTIAGERDDASFDAEPVDDVGLVVGKHLRLAPLDAQVSGNRRRGDLVVAGDHDDLDVLLAERSQSGRGGVLDPVGDADDDQGGAALRWHRR